MQKKLWFKRKRIGWGWTPSSWEGWALTFLYIAILIALSFHVSTVEDEHELIFKLFIPLFVFTAVLIKVAYEHGEKPKWQWNPFKKDS